MDFCTRCGRRFKPWTAGGVTVAGYGPTCARMDGLLPKTFRRRKKRRARKIDPSQLDLELTL